MYPADSLGLGTGATAAARRWATRVFPRDVDVHPLVRRWRSQTVDLALPGVALVLLPAIIDALINDTLGVRAAGRGAVWLAYALIAVLAIVRRIDPRVRTWGVLALVLGLSVFATARTGSAGVGAFVLLGLPIITVLLLGLPSGWLATALSLAAYLGLAALARMGVIPGPATPGSSAAAQESWSFQGLVLAGLLIPTMYLLDRLFRLHATILENERVACARVADELRTRERLEREIVDVQTRERHAIGQELHDGVCQLTAGAHLRVSVLATRAAVVDPRLAAELGAVAEALRGATADAKRLTEGLCPTCFPHDSLHDGLEALAKTTRDVHGVDCGFGGDGCDRGLGDEIVVNLYKIAYEAVANAVLHAGAESIDIDLRAGGTGCCLTIRDDGHGISAGSVAGMGIQLMHQRARQLGAVLTIRSNVGRGTTVTCALPASSTDGRSQTVGSRA